MNVFADLIEELKEENLLEETVIDINNRLGKAQHDEAPKAAPLYATDDAVVQDFALEGEIAPAVPDEMIHETATPIDERDFYRKRAMEEVSSLQMVEHVLSGIEREHMKMAPETYDDLAVKKALHKFLQVTSDVSSDEHSESEYVLMQETENWYSALAKRDSNISVANIRRFCENSRPILSSQALMALARFYRNSPYSEPVRGKFDFVMTRLFSRDTENENRKLLFERKEMIGHIRTLYANWASLSLFPSGQDDSGVTDAVTQFEILIREAREAPTFDSLIASDFFNRIRLFKESASEMFFAADVVAAAIDCNVRIGNRFVDLIQAERESDEAEKKYGYSYDTIVSNAASKTLLLVDLLKDEAVPVEELESDLDEIEPEPISTASYDRAPVKEVISFSPRSVNWWLIGTMIVVLIISAGIYLWSENAVESSGAVEKAASIDLSTSDLNTHIRQASSSSETLYGIINPSWDALSDDEKKDFLKKSLQFANAVKLKRVNLMNNKGRTVGFASADRLEILNP